VRETNLNELKPDLSLDNKLKPAYFLEEPVGREIQIVVGRTNGRISLSGRAVELKA